MSCNGNGHVMRYVEMLRNVNNNLSCVYIYIPSSKLTWQQKMDMFKMYLLLNMEDFNCHVSSPEDTF